MSDHKQPDNLQHLMEGEWHGCPALFDHDGTHVGTNIVSRASEFRQGRTTMLMEVDFDATGPLMDRFENGARMEFGVIESDKNRIYAGPDFVGSGRSYGLLVDSRYHSTGWNVDLHTINHVVPELGLQVNSSQLFEADTLIAVFNGLYTVTHDHDRNRDTQKMVVDFLEKEKVNGKKPFYLPANNSGVFRGEFEVYSDQQELVGHNNVTITHRPINLLHSEQTIEIEGVINRKWTALRTRNGGSHQFHGPDMFGSGKSYGRYLYSVRHVLGEAFKLWSRETVVDRKYTTVCMWQFLESQKEQYTTFGVLRFEPD